MLWIIGLRLITVVQLEMAGVSSKEVIRVYGSMIGSVPLLAFLAVTLRRPDITMRAYWFLPLYYLASAISSLFVDGFLLFTQEREFIPVTLAAGWNALPHLTFGIALWLLRPRVLDGSVANTKANKRK